MSFKICIYQCNSFNKCPQNFDTPPSEGGAFECGLDFVILFEQTEDEKGKRVTFQGRNMTSTTYPSIQ